MNAYVEADLDLAALGVDAGGAVTIAGVAQHVGPLPLVIIERIASASSEQIEIWFALVFDARSIDEVFAD